MKRRLFTLLLVWFGLGLAQSSSPPMIPDSSLTPGDVLTSDANVVCVSGYSARVRNVSAATKRQVFQMYGLVKKVGEDWEVDHLVALELGGSNSVRNLWPEAGFTSPLNYRIKDRLENALRDLVCSGRLDLKQVQQEIAANWPQAYKDYLGNLTDGSDPSKVIPTPPGVVPNTPQPSSPAIQPSEPPATVPTPSQPVGLVLPNPDGSCPESAPIKGSRSGIYHLPQGDANYARTRAVACFATVADAQAAGYRAAR